MQNKSLSSPLTEQQTSRIVWVLLWLMPLIGMAVDLIAPSLPAISDGLFISSRVAKYVISIYLVGYALGNFFTGFLTDAFGRQKLLRINLFIFMLVSTIPIFFPHIEFLLCARFFQGLSMGAVAVLARAIFADILPPEKLVRFGVLIGTMWSLGPIVGPILGGYLQNTFSWKAGFYFFSLIAFIGFIAIYKLVPETHLNINALNIKTIKKNLLEVISHRQFMGIIILMGFLYSLVIVFNTLGSFVIQSRLHYSVAFFGYVGLCLGLVFLIATLICRYLLKKHDTDNIFYMSIKVSLAMSAVFVMLSHVFENSITLTVLASILMYFTCGFLFPMSMGKGLSLFRHLAGTATAVMYLVTTLITSLSSFLASFINHQEYFFLVAAYLVLLLVSVFVYRYLIQDSIGRWCYVAGKHAE